MRFDHEGLGRSARAISDAGTFLEHAVHAAEPTASSLGRVGAALSAARLGARLLPAGRRLFERYPLASTLFIVGVIAAVYVTRPARMPARP